MNVFQYYSAEMAAALKERNYTLCQKLAKSVFFSGFQWVLAKYEGELPPYIEKQMVHK